MELKEPIQDILPGSKPSVRKARKPKSIKQPIKETINKPIPE